MAGILASSGCFCQNVDIMMSKHSLKENFSFAGSVSGRNSKPGRRAYSLPVGRDDFRVRMKMQQDAAEFNGQSVGTQPPKEASVSGQDKNLKSSSRLSTTRPDTPTRYGEVVKMVPASEIVKRKSVSFDKVKKVNELKPIVNGSLVKSGTSTNSVETTKFDFSYGHPLVEELKILPSDEGFSWATENYSSWQRTMDIWYSVISLYIRIRLDNAKWTYLGGCTENKQKKRRRKTAAWLRERILQLGPTFIKLGQLSSTRSDLFPQEFVDELAKLQDRVPAFSPEKARNLIKTELGEPVDILFKDFEDQPIAAASLGQVHRAILHSGEKVVVKVQRPGLNKLFDIDLGNLKLVAEYFQKSETFGGPTRDWIGIYRECSKILYQEIDYINEAKNSDRFRRDFRNIKWVRIPLVYWNYTARRVLTLEYVPGIKINNLDALDSRGYNRSRISTLASEAYLIQILKTGFFHADPHPGNLAIDSDEALIYYDYGMMGEIESFTQERLHELFYSVYEKDAKEVVKSLIELGVLQPTGDMSSVRRTVQYFLDNSLSHTLDQKQTFAAIGEDLFAIAQDQPFRFPATFTFVLRAFTTLEGIGRAIHPDYSFLKIATPYAQGLLDSRQKQQSGIQIVQGMRKQADDARTHALSMPCRIQRIEEILKQLESGDLKLRVRVLESERAARKAEILQKATIQTILGGALLNIAVTLSNQGSQVIATGSFLGAGILLALFASSMQRVKKLDKLELSL